MSARLTALEPDTPFPLGEIFIRDGEGARIIDKLARRQVSVQRDFFRALAELRRLQESRIQSATLDAMSAEPDRVRFDNPAPVPACPNAPVHAPAQPPRAPALRL